MVAVSASTANDTTPSRIQPTWLALLGFGLATRLIVVVLGCFLALPESSVKSRVVHSPHNDGMNLRHLAALSSGSRRWIEPWYRWDAMWYLDISQRGYSYRPGSESSVAFMPLLPLLIKTGVTVGFDPYWSGLLIRNLAFVAGLALFGRAVLRVTESAATTWRACTFLLAFPSSFYFSAPYQESLGLALTAAALLAWLNHRPAQSAAALAPASAAQLTALSMSVGLVMEWALDLIRGRPARHSAWLVAIAGTLGTVLFFGYLTLRFHDPLLHLKARAAWLRKTPSVPQLLGAIWSLVRVSMVMLQRSGVFTLSLMLILTWLCHKPLRSAYLRLARTVFRRRAADPDRVFRSPLQPACRMDRGEWGGPSYRHRPSCVAGGRVDGRCPLHASHGRLLQGPPRHDSLPGPWYSRLPEERTTLGLHGADPDIPGPRLGIDPEHDSRRSVILPGLPRRRRDRIESSSIRGHRGRLPVCPVRPAHVLCELDIRRVTGIPLRDGALPPAQDRGFFRKATRRCPRRFGFFRVPVSSRTINHAGSRVRSSHRSG